MAQKTNSLTLDINVVSAKDLVEVDPTSSKTKLYVVVLFTGTAQKKQKFQTPVDKDCGRNPTWNFPVKFNVHVDGLKQDLKTGVVFALKCEEGKSGKDLGQVHVSVAELLQVCGNGNSMQYVAVSYPVKKPSGFTVGMFNFEYKFGGSAGCARPTRNVGGEYPAQGYYYPPPPPAAAGYGGYPPTPYPYNPYPPQSPSYYTPPPPQYPPYIAGYYGTPPYGYPPHPGHVHAHHTQRSIKDKNKNKSWKMGTKILGAVGALAVGAISGGSVPNLSGLSSGFQMPDYTSSFATQDFSNLYTCPDPSSTYTFDYSSFM